MLEVAVAVYGSVMLEVAVCSVCSSVMLEVAVWFSNARGCCMQCVVQ